MNSIDPQTAEKFHFPLSPPPAPAGVEVQRVDASLMALQFEGERETRDETDVADAVVHKLGPAGAK